MATVRTEKNQNYTHISNVALNDKNLSLKAKGLWAFIMSKPNDWKINYRGLVSQLKEGQTAILATLDELEEAGYLIRGEITKDRAGKFKTADSIMYEQPCVGFPRVDSPRTKVTTDKTNTIVPNGSPDSKINSNSVIKLVDEPSNTSSVVGNTTPEKDTVLKHYYLVVKKYSLVVVNNTHVKKWAKDLENALGYDHAMLYLLRLQQRDLRKERETQEFVPALSTPLEICTKAPKIIEYLKRTKDLSLDTEVHTRAMERLRLQDEAAERIRNGK